jgi:hypothetical protein
MIDAVLAGYEPIAEQCMDKQMVPQQSAVPNSREGPSTRNDATR